MYGANVKTLYRFKKKILNSLAMTKTDIKSNLLKNHQHFIATIQSLPEEEFLLSVNNKWSAGQQLDHIYRSVQPMALALALPKFLLALIFGKANRPSKNYTELVEKYKTKLAAGYKVSAKYSPNDIVLSQRDSLGQKLLGSINKVNKRIDSFSEKDLDNYILPHPLLGKLTIREMLFFTIYHVQHHEVLTLKNLGK